MNEGEAPSPLSHTAALEEKASFQELGSEGVQGSREGVELQPGRKRSHSPWADLDHL